MSIVSAIERRLDETAGCVIQITVIAMRVRHSDLAGERRYGQHALIRGLVGPLPDRRPERAAIACGVRRGHYGLGTTFLLALL